MAFWQKFVFFWEPCPGLKNETKKRPMWGTESGRIFKKTSFFVQNHWGSLGPGSWACLRGWCAKSSFDHLGSQGCFSARCCWNPFRDLILYKNNKDFQKTEPFGRRQRDAQGVVWRPQNVAQKEPFWSSAGGFQKSTHWSKMAIWVRNITRKCRTVCKSTVLCEPEKSEFVL